MHEPFERKHTNADTAVVFTHGFIGSPDQFEDLAGFVHNNNCTAISVLLPGHGATAKEFSAFRLKDWENHLENELLRISQEYKNIILVGHSIGGLMSLNASLNKKLNIKGVLLLSSPLKLKLSLSVIMMGIKLRVFHKSQDEILKVYRESVSVSGASPLRYIFWFRQASDVLRLIAKTKSNLSRIVVPAVIISSKKDEITSPKTIKIFNDGLVKCDKRIVILTDSRHAYYTPRDRELIKLELLSLI